MGEKVWAAGILAVGLIAGGGVLGYFVRDVLVADRTVQVKGAAELPVEADLGTWRLGMSSSADDLASAQTQMAADVAKTRAFLAEKGILADEMETENLNVNDTAANPYGEKHGPRFTISGGVLVRTGNLKALAAAKNALGDLVGQGVALTNVYGPNYAFTSLNAEKPKLIAESTAAAAAAARQFAKDSGASVGAIRHARQGSVEILGRDSDRGEAEQVNKILRVVTTVDYGLR